MTSPELLGALASLHGLLRDLLTDTKAGRATRPLDPQLGCMSWQFAHAVFEETYWLREHLVGDSDLTARVRHLFAPTIDGAPPDWPALCQALPPPEHLVKWAAEIQAEHLRRLATPGALPDHPMLREDRLPWFLLQEAARAYERLLALGWLAACQEPATPYRASQPLIPAMAAPDVLPMTQGHYRIGSRHDPLAYDHELPPQAVELASFRIARRPVSNAAYLAFMEAGGYQDASLWDDAGLAWRDAAPQAPRSPLGWRQDAQGAWFEINLRGPADLPADQPVSGINRHEARAFAAWTAALGGDHAGAVVQHEYQWEVAARVGLIADTGRVWEWCANPFHPYPDFVPFPDQRVSASAFDRIDGVRRGACLHTHRALRRASYRAAARPDERAEFSGVRLVYPPH